MAASRGHTLKALLGFHESRVFGGGKQMMTADELQGLITSLEVLAANGFGTMKEEIKICQYILNFGGSAV